MHFWPKSNLRPVLGSHRSPLGPQKCQSKLTTAPFLSPLCCKHPVDQLLLQNVSNHPVHILDNKGDLSTSSFIPFCSFGEDIIGAKLINFDIPVCNIFKPTNYFDQICYEADLQKLKESKNEKLAKQLEMGLTLVLDYNEERQIGLNSILRAESSGMTFSYSGGNSASIYLDSISILEVLQAVLLPCHCFR